MGSAQLDVLYEDNHLLVVNKPTGLPTMGVAPGEPSVVQLAKAYLKQKYRKPGNVYLGVVSRLDAAASGVLLLARTSKAAARLSEQFRSRQVGKIYWAIVPESPRDPHGTLLDWIAKDESQKRMVVASPKTPGAKQAKLAYRQIAGCGGFSLLEIELESGRKHQIRVQLAARGLPIVGDRKYGSRVPLRAGGRKLAAGNGPQIALHARRLVITHPVRGEALEFVAPTPDAWRRWGLTDKS